MSTFLVVNNNSIETQASASEPYLKVEDGYLQLTTETSAQGAATLSNSTTTYIVVQSAQTTTQTYTTTQSKAANSYSATRYIPVESALSLETTGSLRHMLSVNHVKVSVLSTYKYFDMNQGPIYLSSPNISLQNFVDYDTTFTQYSFTTSAMAAATSSLAMEYSVAVTNSADAPQLSSVKGQYITRANPYGHIIISSMSESISSTTYSGTNKVGTSAAEYSSSVTVYRFNISSYSEYTTDMMYSSTWDRMFPAAQAVTSVTEQITETETITI